MSKHEQFAAGQPFRDLSKTIRELSHRHSTHNVFSDFIEMAALALSNAVDIRHYEKREARYMEIVRKYSADEVQKFPKALAHLTDAFEEETTDHLGRLFHDLELHNTYRGQFFTPYHLSRMMAQMTFGDDHKAIIGERGFLNAQEPACGSGGMVLALADVMRSAGVNYQKHLHVTAVDIDARCVHMAYVQMTLMHIPAVIVHGNTLTLEEYDHWHTAAHVLGFWDGKLARMRREDRPAEPALVEAAPVAPEKPPASMGMPAKAVQLTLF
jgi:type I restriction-modification system DNA methylase subunit